MTEWNVTQCECLHEESMSATIQLEVAQPRTGTPFSLVLGYPAILLGSLMLIVFMLALRSGTDPDIGWHLRNAEVTLHLHRFIREDTYSFTTFGMPWIDHEWLAEMPYDLGWRLGGTRGLLMVSLVVLEAIFAGVFYLAWLQSRRPNAAWVATIVSVVFGTVSFAPRTLLFGWAALVTELIVLARFEKQRGLVHRGKTIKQIGLLWPLPLIFLLWINLHGSWLIGFVLLLLYVACGSVGFEKGAVRSIRWTPDEFRALALVTAACCAALFANPYGLHLVTYPFDMAFHQKLNIASVQEWQPLDWHSLRGRIFFVTLVLGLAAQLFRPRKWKLHELVFVCVGIHAAFNYQRFLFLAGILVLPFLAADLPRMPRRCKGGEPPQQRVLHACLLLGMVLCGLLAYRARREAVGSEVEYPKGVLPMLAALRKQAPLLNSYDWGGYLELRLPELPVMIDSRTDIFERKGVLRDYLDAIRIQNTFAVLDKYHIEYVLFQPDTPLVYLLRRSSDWKIDYQDKTAVLLERLKPVNSSNLESRP